MSNYVIFLSIISCHNQDFNLKQSCNNSKII